jgi:hypothetical protein
VSISTICAVLLYFYPGCYLTQVLVCFSTTHSDSYMMSCGRDVYSVFTFVFTVVKIVILRGRAGISLPAQKHYHVKNGFGP